MICIKRLTYAHHLDYSYCVLFILIGDDMSYDLSKLLKGLIKAQQEQTEILVQAQSQQMTSVLKSI